MQKVKAHHRFDVDGEEYFAVVVDGEIHIFHDGAYNCDYSAIEEACDKLGVNVVYIPAENFDELFV